MVDEQKLRELAGAANLGVRELADMNSTEFHAADEQRRKFRHEAPAAILSLLDELQTLRSERTAWRVTAENAEPDAARYRWLRIQEDEDFLFGVVKNPHFDVYESAEELDAAIDAAMKDES